MSEIGKAFIRVPRKIEEGEIIQVKSRIVHPQYNGRTKVDGQIMAMNYIKQIQVFYGEEELMSLTASASLSTNPKFDFKLKATKKADLRILWTDNHGQTYEAKKTVKL